MNVIVATILLAYALSFFLAPFPHWPTYLLLWKNVLGNREPGIHLRARLGQVSLLLRYLAFLPLSTCLWYLDDVLFPAYRRQAVKPVFIFGQPRSGSTFLHRTLAGDAENFFALRHVEWRFPFIVVQKLIAYFQLEYRIKSCNYWPNTEDGRRAAKMHPNTLYDWEEDGIFFEERFLYHYFVLFRFPFVNLLPQLDDFALLSAREQNHILATHKKVIQKIMYLRGHNKFYLSKEVESMTKMAMLAKLYPDAVFITVARRSDQYLNSLLSLIAFSTRCKTSVDTAKLGDWRAANLAKKQRDCRLQIALLDELDEDRQIRLAYSNLVGRIADTVSSVYARLDFEMPPATLARLAELQQSQNERERGYDYDAARIDGFDFFDAFVAEVEDEHNAVLATLRLAAPALTDSRADALAGVGD